MSPLAHVTEVDQGGGVEDEVTADHEGSPERLGTVQTGVTSRYFTTYLIDVTSQPLVTADLQMREPRNPFPPATTMLFFTFFDIVDFSGTIVIAFFFVMCKATSGKQKKKQDGESEKSEGMYYVMYFVIIISGHILTSPGHHQSLDHMFARVSEANLIRYIPGYLFARYLTDSNPTFSDI